MEADTRRLPSETQRGDDDVEIRVMRADDATSVLGFARALPRHDLLFLPRDITQPKVLDAWVRELDCGTLTSLLAVRDGVVLGCATLNCDPLSWSPHVGELRVVVSAGARGGGLGRRLAEEGSTLGLSRGLEKMLVRMTVDQRSALAIFESMGYRAEALLRDQVKDTDGVKHDIVILSHDVAAFEARANAYGASETLQDAETSEGR